MREKVYIDPQNCAVLFIDLLENKKYIILLIVQTKFCYLVLEGLRMFITIPSQFSVLSAQS